MLLADIVSHESLALHAGDILEGCRVVKIHRDVMKTAGDLVERTPENKLRELSKFTVWPDYSTWMETDYDEGRRIGFLFHGIEEKSVRYGFGIIVLEYEDKERVQIPVRYDMEGYDLRWQLPVDHQRLLELSRSDSYFESTREEARRVLVELQDEMGQRLKHAPVLAAIKPLLFTYLALMNSPKLIRKREIDVRRLNARRLKKGKYLFHPHHEVRLNIDKHVTKITEGQGDGPERALHFVRAHPRFLVHPRYKNVSVVMVPPHYRGNPELGIMNTSYAMDRKNSKWKEPTE